MIEDQPQVKVRVVSSQRELSKPSFTIRKGGPGGAASKPFQIKRKVEELTPAQVDPPSANRASQEMIDEDIPEDDFTSQ